MPAEQTQQQGKDGAAFAKRWLESTTWLELPFNAYRTQHACTLKLLDGSDTVADLAGMFLTDPYDRMVYVEAKNYTSSSGLQGHYEAFLAHAYSATAQAMKGAGKKDPKFEFIFVTRHPFGPESKWSHRLELSALEEALEKHSEVLGEDEYNSSLGATVMQRVWLLVYHDKQEQLTLTQSEIFKTLDVLKRKKEGIS
jgi:hypothetical protein